MKLIQVIMIGIKFYPILVVADADPNIFICFVSTVYMLIIWVFRFLKKSFCSRSDAFIALTISKLSTQLNDTLRSTFYTRYNASNIALGLFSDDDNPNEKYLSAMKNLIPSVFKEYFGKYRPVDDSASASGGLYRGDNDYDTDMLLLAADSASAAGSSGYPGASPTTPSSYYLYSDTNNNNMVSSTLAPLLQMSSTSGMLASASSSTISYGMRAALKNKTLTAAKTLKGFYYQRDEDFMNMVSVLENLPLYVTLSYLLVRYGMLFVGCLLDKLNQGCAWPCRTTSANANAAASRNPATNSYEVIKRQFDKVDSIATVRTISLQTQQQQQQQQNLQQSSRAHLIDNNNNNNNTDFDYDSLIMDLNRDYKERDRITDQIFERHNHNYLYIKRLFRDYSIFGQSSAAAASASRMRHRASFLWHFVETNIYHKVCVFAILTLT